MKNLHGKFEGPVSDVFTYDPETLVMAAPDGGGGPPEGKGGGGGPPAGNGPPEGEGPPDGHGGGGGGKPGTAGSKKGELFGDQLVLLRDLDPNEDDQDDDGSGAPMLDAASQLIVVGYDPLGTYGGDDGLFPIYFHEVGEGDYEIPADFLPYVQEVELERANVARAPDKVAEKALLAALEKITDDDGVLRSEVTTDAAGRLMYESDGTWFTIDAPLENLALYQALMTAGAGDPGYGWPDVTDAWGAISVGGDSFDLSGLNDLDGWDPSALIGAAWSKEGEITLDALLYENTTLGVNVVAGAGESLNITYFDFEDGTTETYDYVRSDAYGDIWIGWWEFGETPEGEPTATLMKDTVLNAVFANPDHDPEVPGSLPYVEWGVTEDVYLALNEAGDEFVYVDASNSGVNDFAQAADDSRAVIAFIHETFAEMIDAPEAAAGYEIA